MRFKEQEFERREQAILDAALALFEGDDWQSVTVERIAEEVGIAKGTIYKHFRTKEEIYARIALDDHRELAARLERIARAGSLEERIEAVVDAFWERTRAPRALQRVVQYCARPDFQRSIAPDLRRSFADMDTRIASVVTPVLTDGVQDGRFPDLPLPLLSFPAQALLRGAVELAWGGCLEGVDARVYRDRLVAALVAGLEAR